MSLIQDALRRQEEDKGKDGDGDGDKKDKAPEKTNPPETSAPPVEPKPEKPQAVAKEEAKAPKKPEKKSALKKTTEPTDQKPAKPSPKKESAPSAISKETKPPAEQKEAKAKKQSLKIISKSKVVTEPTPPTDNSVDTVTVAEAAAKAAEEAAAPDAAAPTPAPSPLLKKATAATPPPPPPPPPSKGIEATPSVLNRKSPIEKIESIQDATQVIPPPPPPPAKDEIPMPPPPPPSSTGNEVATETNGDEPAQVEEPKAKKKKKAKKRATDKQPKGKGALVGVLVLLIIACGAGFAVWKGYIPLEMLTGGGDSDITDTGQEDVPPEPSTLPNTGSNETTVVSAPPETPQTTNDAAVASTPQTSTNAVTNPINPEPDPGPKSAISLILRHRLNNGNDVNAVDVSPDGRLALSFVSREKANIWETETGTLKNSIPTAGLHTLRFDNSGKHIILHGAELTVYRLSDKKLIQTHDWLAPDTGGSMNAIDISNDGSLSALGGANSKTIILWSLTENKISKEITLPVGSGVSDLSFSRDGSRLAAAGTDFVYLFDTTTGQLLFSKNAKVPDQIALSPDGKHAAHLISSEIIAVIDTTDGEQLRVIKDTGKSTLTELIFSADGKYLLGSSWDGHIYAWEFDSGNQVAKVQAHDEWITSMSLSENGKVLVTGSDDDTIGVWDVMGLPSITIDGPALAEAPKETDTAPETPPTQDPARPVVTNIVEVTPTEPVSWPSLKINGLMGQGEKGAVIINDDIIRIGYSYDDVKVIEIKGKTVVLEYKNETRKLMVGSSTN